MPRSRPRAYADLPPWRHAPYRSTALRGPTKALVPVTPSPAEQTGPGPARARVMAEAADLSIGPSGEPAIGSRILVTGRVVDDLGQPVPECEVEIWQANAAGRYAHAKDVHDAPLDPSFTGVGRVRSDEHGRYAFRSIKPGAYPWGNHDNAWRPAHIHLSVYGPSLATRLVTQLYFEGDPLLALDPIFQAVPEHARPRLVARYDHDATQPFGCLGYRFDIVLRGPEKTPEAP